MGYNRVDPATGMLSFGVQQVYYKVTDKVTATTTKTVDTIPTTGLSGLEITLSLFNKTQNKSRMLKMLVRVTDTDCRNQVYAKSGDNLNVLVDASLSGANTIVTVVNNEAFDLDCTIIRATL